MSVRLKRVVRCPQCGCERLKRHRAVWRVALGLVLTMVGVLLALFTLGASLAFALVGMALLMPRLRCQECGWLSAPQSD
jgi:predicted Zn-ribbon and HTH transcriptional regulator